MVSPIASMTAAQSSPGTDISRAPRSVFVSSTSLTRVRNAPAP
jgi:hypothetical protein